MTDQTNEFPGSLASKGLPTPILNELEHLIEHQHITEAMVPEKAPALAEQLMQFYERQYSMPVENKTEFAALVTAETWNYLYQMRDGKAAQEL
ncbi:hypothetical protein [Hymenobacter cavernae]|uniref:Uncharacterized protein n=1 Tax=Hymenobacter cavernae TaxID=2044852 RepID=A0ABQ1U9P0_9BACT|nr:hypothetical protein [Hymenobacter cavernae]GGF14003.1 hypothetical protein GCM10011383_26550 [Hymenobacter cavernae]